MGQTRGSNRDFAQAVDDISGDSSEAIEEAIDDVSGATLRRRVDSEIEVETQSTTDDGPEEAEAVVEEEPLEPNEELTDRDILQQDEYKEKKGIFKMSALEHEIKTEQELTGLSENTTYITSDTVISGNIEIDGDLEMLGRVDGNIHCTGKLVVGGRVNGDITTGDLYADNAHIDGTIISGGIVRIGAGSVVVGNISAESAVISGAVKGDIDIKGDIEVGSTAVIVGDIKSKSVQVSSGAVVEGMCKQVYASVDVNQYFADGIQNLDERKN